MSQGFPGEIQQAILKSDLFVLIWSQDAAASRYVKKELELSIAQNMQRDLPILTVRLDDTPLPDAIGYMQAYDMRAACDDAAAADLAAKLPPDLRVFSHDKPLEAQRHTSVAGTPFVSVQIGVSPSGYCRAYIVGPREHALPRSPQDLAICLQFFQGKDNNMLEAVHRTLKNPQAWMLHIVGPDHPTRENSYGLANDQPAQWRECADFTVQMIERTAKSGATTLHFFTLTPNALLAGITRYFGRFWHVVYYNWFGGDTRPYAPILEYERNT